MSAEELREDLRAWALSEAAHAVEVYAEAHVEKGAKRDAMYEVSAELESQAPVSAYETRTAVIAACALLRDVEGKARFTAEAEAARKYLARVLTADARPGRAS